MTKKLTRLETIEAKQAEAEFARQQEAETELERLMAQAKADCETLQFDFDDISWDDANAIADILSREFVASEEGDHDAINEARAEMRGFLARIVEYVPDEWFVSSLNGATKDFTDPQLYRSIKATKIGRVTAAMNYALGEEQKN